MFRVNTTINGIGAVFKRHEEEALNVIEDGGTLYVGTAEIWRQANLALAKAGDEIRSRATYINFVQELHEAGLLEAIEITGKGGRRDVYRFPDGGFKKFKHIVATQMIAAIIEAFPEADYNQIVNELYDLEVIL